MRMTHASGVRRRGTGLEGAGVEQWNIERGPGVGSRKREGYFQRLGKGVLLGSHPGPTPRKGCIEFHGIG
jgi:hypothetical protein